MSMPWPSATQLDALKRIAATKRKPFEHVLESWNERAAIREYDGGQSRSDAERDAIKDVERM
jgi:hypothetical protein